MPKKIDQEVKARAVRLVRDHREEYPSATAAATAVAEQLGVGRETVRRWVVQAQVDDGHRDGPTSEELAEIRELKAENARLRGGQRDLEGGDGFLRVNAILSVPGGVRSFLCCPAGVACPRCAASPGVQRAGLVA